VLKITPSEDASGHVHLMLEGSLTGPWVTELQTLVANAGEPSSPMVLDLGGLHYIDEEGLSLIRKLRKLGANIHNASPFVRALLFD